MTTARQRDMAYPPHQTQKWHVIRQERQREVDKKLSRATREILADPEATMQERVVAIRYRLRENLRRSTKVARTARRANLKDAKRVRRMKIHKAANAALRGTGKVDWSQAEGLIANIKPRGDA